MRASPVSPRFSRLLTAAVSLIVLLSASLSVIPVNAAAPTAPGDLTATASESGQIVLKWSDRSADETGFRIERANDTYFINFKVSFNAPANAVTFSDNTVAVSTTYYYRVMAINADGVSPASNTAEVTSPARLAFPVSPGDLTYRLPGSGQVSLKWTDLSTNEDGFRIERAEDEGFSKGLATFSVPAGAESYNDQNLKPLAVYYYRVIAYNSAGDSPPSNIISARTLDYPPAAPSDLDAASPEAWHVRLRWVDQSNNETGFRIERASDANFSQDYKVFTAEANATGGNVVVIVTDWQVPAGLHYFRVKSFNEGGESAPSKAVQVTVSDQYEDALATWESELAVMSFPGFGLVGRRVKVNSDGQLKDNLGDAMDTDLTLEMTDGSGSLVIPRTAKALNANGHALTVISYDETSVIPEPQDNRIIVRSFTFGPGGANFDKPVTLNLKYDPEDLPQGTTPANFKVALWTGTAWQDVAAQVKTDLNQLVYKSNKLGQMAIVAEKPDLSAKFSISNLYLFPASARLGEPVYITARVANTGASSGEYQLSLRVNDNVVRTQNIALEAGKTTDVKFTLENQPAGRYRVDLNGLRGDFVVKVPETPTPTPTAPATTTAPPATTTSSPTATTESPTFAPIIRFNNTLIMGIIGGSVVIIILAVAFFLAKK